MAKFISIRFDPTLPTQVYANSTATPVQNTPELKTFTIEGPFRSGPPGSEAKVEVIPLRWPVVYPSPVLFRLGAQWSTPIEELGMNDRTGLDDYRSLESIEFTYDRTGKTLSWTQAQGGLTGSVKFTKSAPVWYVILRPAGGVGSGFLKVKNTTVAKI